MKQPSNLQQREAPVGYQKKVKPPFALGDTWVVAVVFECIQHVLEKVIGQDGPRNDPTNDKSHDKEDRQDNLEGWQGLGESPHAVHIIKVGQETEDSRGNFGQANKEKGIKIGNFGSHAPVGGQAGKDVMKDKFGSVIEENRVVEIFDLVTQEKETNAIRGRIIRQGSVQVGRLDENCTTTTFLGAACFLLFDRRVQVPNTFVLTNAQKAQKGTNAATQRVHTNVTGQDASIQVILQQGMKVLVLDKPGLA